MYTFYIKLKIAPILSTFMFKIKILKTRHANIYEILAFVLQIHSFCQITLL